MSSGFAPAWQPFARYADFSGRARRSDLLFFYVLTGALNSLIDWAGLAMGFDYHRWISLAFSLALLCPWAAVAVRRLHDIGRSGWWLLLALPAFALNMWSAVLLLRDGAVFRPTDAIPGAVSLAVAVSLLALIVLLMWKDDEETNIYGPNPRYGGPEEATA